MSRLSPRTVLWFCATVLAVHAGAQEARILPAINMTKRGVPPANYSGITRIGPNRYALVSDKEPTDGFYPLELELNTGNGLLRHLKIEDFRPQCPTVAGGTVSKRDCEGIVYVPRSGTLFISGEGDQEILEYTLEGIPTGRRLKIPVAMKSDKIHPNYGFEALAYDEQNGLFWTTTESTLKADGMPAGVNNRRPNLLRLQSFGDDLRPATQYVYLTDAPETDRTPAQYAFGVPAMAALPGGRLLIMEREFFVSPSDIGSWVNIKLYAVDPASGQPVTSADTCTELLQAKALKKTPVASFTTRLALFDWRLANYEGMCLGPVLDDGRQTLLLVSDSQGGYGKGKIRLKDYLRVVILPWWLTREQK